MGGGTVALLLLALGLISFGVALRPRNATAGAANARELEEAITRAADLISSAKSLGRELEDTGMAVAEQAGQHLRALKSAVADADKQMKALRAIQPGARPAPPPVEATPLDLRVSGARLDVSVDDTGVREIAPAGPGSDRHSAIYKLADEGRTVDEIAQALDLGKGEVQLILSLRRPA